MRRKKRPDAVRRQLLDAAARIVGEDGPGRLTLDIAARAAGVSKGGLLHHFPNKQALLDGLLDDMLERLERRIADAMAADPDPAGRFSRAYLDAVSGDAASEDLRRDGLLSVALLGEAGLRARWSAWLDGMAARHDDADDDTRGWIVRLAADGLWMADLAGTPDSLRERRADVLAMLRALTRGGAQA